MTGTIFLAAQEISVSETDGEVLIAFARTGDLSGEVTITFGITPDSATDGADYIGFSGTVVLAAGQDRVSISVDILNDLLGEATESFVVSLINVDSGFIDAPRTTRVSILDDENPVTPPAEPPLSANYEVSLDAIITGLDQPMKMEFSPTDPSLAFVAEKGGVIKTVNLETGQVTGIFLDLSLQVNNIQDRGLMDIAFHPDLENNPYFYAFYVADPPEAAGQSGAGGLDGNGNRYAHVVRYTLDASTNYTTIIPDSDVIIVGGGGQGAADISGGGAIDSTDPANAGVTASDLYLNGSETNVIGGFKQDYIKVDSLSHVGGALAFGPDGALYVSIGDGVSFNFADPRITSVQDLNSLAGKILRIDAVTGQGLADNPFFSDGMSLDSNASKVFMLGVRNPFTMGFDPDGRLFFTETGWNTYEEINSGGAGANFGWPWYEGGDGGVLLQTGIFRDFAEAQAFYQAVADGEIDVTAAYRAFAHESALPGYQVQAITGGDVIYTGDIYPEAFLNDFFFVDHSQGELYSIDVNDRQEIEFLFQMPSGYGPVHLTQGPDGYVYYVDLVTGQIGRLIIENFEIGPDDFLVNGAATAVEGATGEYILTSGPMQAGSVMSGGRLDLRQDFVVSFQMLFGASDGGADGASFVLHDAGPAALGALGGGLGAQGIADGLAIVFDTYSNAELGEIANDSSSFMNTETGARSAPVDLGNIEDGAFHNIIVAWNAETSTLVYTLDGAVIGAMSGTNIAQTYFGGADFVRFGFAAGTGGLWNEQRVRILSIDQDANAAPVASDDAYTIDAGAPFTIAASALLADDTDADDDALAVLGVQSAVNGVAALVDGQITFTPNAGFTGEASFEYIVSDGQGGFDIGRVNLTVETAAPPPFIANGSAVAIGPGEYRLTNAQWQSGAVMSTSRVDLGADFSISFEMLFGSSNGGGDGASFVLHNAAAGAGALGEGGGGLGVGGLANGLAIYFDTYSNAELGEIANDSSGFLNTASGARTAPFDLGDIEDGQYHSITVSWNAATSTLLYTIDGAVIATLTDSAVAASYFGGASSVHFGFAGGTGGVFADQRVRAITVSQGDNASPVAADDAYEIDANAPFTIAAAALVGNDSDGDGDGLTIVSVGGAENGVVALLNGQITFIPTVGYTGDAAFSYIVSNGEGGFDSARVTLSVQAAPAPPFVISGSAAALSGGEYRLTDAAWQAGGVMSTSRLALNQDFAISFQMYFGASDGGADGASFVLHNAAAGAAALGQSGGVGLGSGGIENGLAIVFDTYRNAELGEMVNDSTSFLDTDALTRSAAVDLGNIEDGAYHGITVSWNAATSTLVYSIDGVIVGTLSDPNLAATYFGGAQSVHFGFAAATGGLFNDQRVRAISVEQGNAAPVATDDAYVINANAPYIMAAAALTANDADADQDPLQVIAVGEAVNGMVSLVDGQITFTPTAGFAGEASFEYTMSDGQGGFDIGAVRLTVEAGVQPPFIASGSATEIGPDEFRLTSAAWQAGGVMSTAQLDLSADFTVTFDMYFGASDGGADGASFILHSAAAGAGALGALGGGMGASGIQNGLGILFDTYSNTELGEIANDSASFLDTDGGARTGLVDLGNIEDGAYHRIVVSWDASASMLTYRMDGVVIGSLADAALAATYFGGAGSVYFGFAAGTGGLSNDQRVRIISVDTGAPSAALALAAAPSIHGILAPEPDDAFVVGPTAMESPEGATGAWGAGGVDVFAVGFIEPAAPDVVRALPDDIIDFVTTGLFAPIDLQVHIASEDYW